MNRRRPRVLIRIRVRWIDALVAFALFAVMISAIIRWSDKIVADIAIPTAALIALNCWREG